MFRDDHTLNLHEWDGAPRSHHLDPVLEEVSRLVGREPSIDFNTIRELDCTWRDLGAPRLAQFALEQSLKPAEEEHASQKGNWKTLSTVAAKKAIYQRRVTGAALKYSIPHATVGGVLPEWISDDGSLIFLKGSTLENREWVRVITKGTLEIQTQALEGAQLVNGATQLPYARLARRKNGSLCYWDLRYGKAVGKFEMAHDLDRFGCPYVSRDLELVFEGDEGNVINTVNGEVVGSLPSAGPWIVDFQTFSNTRGWKGYFPLAMTQSMYPGNGPDRGTCYLTVFAPKRYPSVLPGIPKWRVVSRYSLGKSSNWGVTIRSDGVSFLGESYGGMLFGLFDGMSVISVGRDRVVRAQWDESDGRVNFNTISLGHSDGDSHATAQHMTMSQWRNWLVYQCIDRVHEMRFIQFLDVNRAQVTKRYYLDDEPRADIPALIENTLCQSDISEGIFAELSGDEITLHDALTGEKLGGVKLGRFPEKGPRKPFGNGIFLLSMAQGSHIGQLIVRTADSFDLYEFQIERVLQS